MTIERYFTENSDGTIEYTPKSITDARYIYDELRDCLSDLRKKINAEQSLLDLTPKENDVLKKDCLEKLKGYKVPVKVQIDYEEQYSDRYKKNRSFNVA